MILKKSISFCLLIIFMISCNTDNEFAPQNLDTILSLRVVNDNALANGIDEVEVIAQFPIDFSTEADDMVDFTVFKETNESISKNIELIQENGLQKKQSSISIRFNKEDSLKVKASISVNKIIISEDVFINFSKAHLDAINITSSALTISPSSFGEIEITTELLRDSGIVSLNSVAETVVKDTLGQDRGVFNNYLSKTNSEGKISNKYTLGNDDYLGRLFVIATSLDINNEIKADTLTIYSQN